MSHLRGFANDLDDLREVRLVGWIRRKHRNVSRKQLRRRFCNRGWRIAHNGVEFTGASSVAMTRYRYRGANIPTPWTQAGLPQFVGTFGFDR